jgi:glutamine---fructose-6-phosphate transaminase (isomerizing)
MESIFPGINIFPKRGEKIVAETPGQYTYNEIQSQPEAWADALNVLSKQQYAILELLRHNHYEQILFTGCGSTYYLSIAGAALTQSMTGLLARACPASEVWLNPSACFGAGKTLLVAVSRSGSTSETVQAVEAFRDAKRGQVIVITNYNESPLASLGEATLIIEAGQEESIAQTRSFASLYVAVCGIAANLAGRDDLLAAMQGLPRIGKQILKQYDDLACTFGQDLTIDRFYMLGSGNRYGLACEANLKMKEMTLTHSEPFHFLEFRHGPKAMVTETTAIVGLLSDSLRDYEKAVLDEMRQPGAHILTLGESEADVSFNSGIPEAVRNVLYLPFLQMTAYYRAVAKGLNPDKPNNLSAVVHLDTNDKKGG